MRVVHVVSQNHKVNDLAIRVALPRSITFVERQKVCEGIMKAGVNKETVRDLICD